MWPCPNTDAEEGFLMYNAMMHLSKLCIDFGIAIDGGKDSLSMVANHGIKKLSHLDLLY